MPKLLSYADVAAILSRVLGRTVTFTARTHDEDLAAFIAVGLPADLAANNAMAFSLIADGDAAWLSADLPDLLGRPARTFEDFAREYASAFTPKAD